MLKMMITYFKEIDENMLVVFDNAEEILYHDRKGFKLLITELIHNCKQLTFLMTSRMTLGVLQDISEKIIVL
jgi:predicted ATPase